MRCLARALPALPLLLAAAPAAAQEARVRIAVPAGPLEPAMLALGRQADISIGLPDASLAHLRVRSVQGRLSPAQALAHMLKGSGARARRVAPGAYLIERAPPAAPSRQSRTPPPADPGAGSEIVVTAAKRDVPLASYPGAVEILDGASIDPAEGRRGTDALTLRLASLASTHLGPGRNKLFIRGIADSSFVGPTQATVGQYWGNSRITYSAPDPSLKLYDIGRVEMLEGPQATLYGAGSLGGVLRVVPTAPDADHVEARGWAGAQLTQHGDPGGDAGALLNLPLRPGIAAVRGLVYSSVDGGYIDDRARGVSDVNRVRTLGGRAALRVSPGDGWTLDLNGIGQEIRGDDGQYADRAGGGLTRASSIAQPFRNTFWLGEFVARKRWDTLELVSALAYARQLVSERFEGVATLDLNQPLYLPGAPAAFNQTNRIEMVTMETRLSRQRADGSGWLLGVSGIANHARVNRRLDLLPGGTTLTGVRNRIDEQTLFGEWSFSLLRPLLITVGARATHARLGGTAEDVDQIQAFRNDPGGSASRDETRLLPSVAASMKLGTGTTLYGRFQQGFRPGGLAVRRDYIQRFKGDRLSALEGGMRHRGDAFDLELGGSWTWWNDIQADLIDGMGFPTTSNIGDGRVMTLGGSARWRPVAALTLDAALYVNRSKVTRPDAILADFQKERSALDRLPNVADASGRLGASYRAPLDARTTIAASGYVRYVGRSTLGIGPILGQRQGDYADTGMDLRLERGRGAVTLSLTNLLDSRGNRFAFGTPFLVRDRNQITPLQPRTLRLGFEIGL